MTRYMTLQEIETRIRFLESINEPTEEHIVELTELKARRAYIKLTINKFGGM